MPHTRKSNSKYHTQGHSRHQNSQYVHPIEKEGYVQVHDVSASECEEEGESGGVDCVNDEFGAVGGDEEHDECDYGTHCADEGVEIYWVGVGPVDHDDYIELMEFD